MFGIGGPELIFILVLALLIFGPKRLPQLGRTLGKGMAEFRRASTELQRAFNTELEDPPPRQAPRATAAMPPAPHEGLRPEPRAVPAAAAAPLAEEAFLDPPVEDTPGERPVWEPIGAAGGRTDDSGGTP